MNRIIAATFLLVPFAVSAHSQLKRTSVPLGDTLNRALDKFVLTSEGSQPFHIRISISEPENPQSPYLGSVEEWWTSPAQWRREVSEKEGMKQTIVVSNGNKTEIDEGDYFPLWLRQFLLAAFEPVPNLSAWTASGLQIEQLTMPNGNKSDACVRTEAKIGEGERATASFTNLCFEGDGRLKFYGSPRYSMEFHDYRGFGKKQYPRRLVSNPEPVTTIVGMVTLLEEAPKAGNSQDRFTPLQANDARFESVPVSTGQMERLSASNPDIVWPSVPAGNLRGHLAMYVSVDTKGIVRETWPLNSDNAALNDAARDQVRQWKMKTAKDASGNLVQVDGGLGFIFNTRIGTPLPQLSDAEVRSLATHIVEPIWPANVFKSGEIIEIEVSVNEKGELTGTGFSKTPNAALGPILSALKEWRFKPLVRDGNPQYFHATVRFTIP